MILAGKIVPFVLMIVSCILAYIFMYLGKKKEFKLRDIPGVTAFEEAVGRCTEMGRPMFLTDGHKLTLKLFGRTGGSMVAGQTILRYVCGLCARNKVPVYLSVGQEELVPLANANMYEAFLTGAAPELYNAENIRFYPHQSYGYGTVALIDTIKPGALIYIGSVYLEAIMFAESGMSLGAIQIAAQDVEPSFFFITCDHTMLGEEMYAATAQLSGDRSQIGSIVGVDFMKIATLIIIIVGVVWKFMAGSKGITDLLNM